MKSAINIALVFNDSNGTYTLKVFPTLISILENNKNNNLNIYLVCKGIKPKYKKEIRLMNKLYGQKIYIIDKFGKYEYLVKFFKQHNTSTLNYGTYFKLLLPLVLPKKVNKVLNFDADDIIVQENLKPFWNINIDNYLIASVQIPEKAEKIEQNNKRLSVKKAFRMGGNAYNLNLMRKTNFEDKIKNIMITRKKILRYQELDVMNIICDGRTKYVDEKYNFVPQNKRRFKPNQIVYHFAGKKFYLYKHILFMNKNYRLMYEKYYNLSKYKFQKKFDIIKTVESIPLFKKILIKPTINIIKKLKLINKIKKI